MTAGRGTRIADDWTPGEAEIAYAAAKGFDLPAIEDMAEAFRDYWLAQSGQRARMCSWSAAWRTWVRNTISYGKRRNAAPVVERRNPIAAGMARTLDPDGGLGALGRAARGSKASH